MRRDLALRAATPVLALATVASLLVGAAWAAVARDADAIALPIGACLLQGAALAVAALGRRGAMAGAFAPGVALGLAVGALVAGLAHALTPAVGAPASLLVLLAGGALLGFRRDAATA